MLGFVRHCNANGVGTFVGPGTPTVFVNGRRLVGGEREEVLIAKCDLAKIEETRQAWPFLRDRRIDAYDPLLDRAAVD